MWLGTDDWPRERRDQPARATGREALAPSRADSPRPATREASRPQGSPSRATQALRSSRLAIEQSGRPAVPIVRKERRPTADLEASHGLPPSPRGRIHVIDSRRSGRAAAAIFRKQAGAVPGRRAVVVHGWLRCGGRAAAALSGGAVVRTGSAFARRPERLSRATGRRRGDDAGRQHELLHRQHERRVSLGF